MESKELKIKLESLLSIMKTQQDEFKMAFDRILIPYNKIKENYDLFLQGKISIDALVQVLEFYNSEKKNGMLVLSEVLSGVIKDLGMKEDKKQ
jgi:CII-binding regulator of phage lambda lysogenization HflD